MWCMKVNELPQGLLCGIAAGEERLTFSEVLDHLENNEEFADWYSKTLAEIPYPAFFWELPPLTMRSMADIAEFVLIESASLAGLRADPVPFRDKFDAAGEMDVIAVDNLGGDARLVVPTPLGSLDAYPHLAAFVRGAPGQQVRSLWNATAQSLREVLGGKPRWLSTAGLGVSWLHLRLDTRPKYYRYGPYKEIP